MSLKIDSHQHFFWKYDPIRYSWIDDSMKSLRKDFPPKDLKPILRKHKFEGCIAVQADQSEEETEMLLQLAAENDFIKGVVGWVDLTAANVGERLKYFSKCSRFKGVRHILYDEQGEFMVDPAFQNGIAKLKDFELTYDILAFDYQLPGAVELVRQFPDQPFVLDHMGKPQISEKLDFEWVRNIKELSSFNNVYCKVSGLVTEADEFEWKKEDVSPFLSIVFEAFGEDRLIFGSDWPVCLAAASYGEVVGLVEEYFSGGSAGIMEKVFSENAERFYGL